MADQQSIRVSHGGLTVTLILDESGDVLLFAEKRYAEKARVSVSMPLSGGGHDVRISYVKEG